MEERLRRYEIGVDDIDQKVSKALKHILQAPQVATSEFSFNVSCSESHLLPLTSKAAVANSTIHHSINNALSASSKVGLNIVFFC